MCDFRPPRGGKSPPAAMQASSRSAFAKINKGLRFAPYGANLAHLGKRRRAMGRKASGAGTLALAMVVWLVPGGQTGAYEGDIHQQLTFIAAQQYNRCVEDSHLPRLTPLQMRYVAKANANRADRAWWKRLFRWNYYDRSKQSPRRVLWLIETRIHDTYDDTLRRLANAHDLSRRFTNLGRIVNHLQDATTPEHVVPIFATRFWRFSFSDRFNGYPVDEDAVQSALDNDCTAVRGSDGTFERLLVDTADRTLASIKAPIGDLPSTWEVFWELDKDADDFGTYGDAGNNFGRAAKFSCPDDAAADGAEPVTQERSGAPRGDRRSGRCALKENDPVYAEYAAARHVDAVRATMTAVAIMQERLQPALVRLRSDVLRGRSQRGPVAVAANR